MQGPRSKYEHGTPPLFASAPIFFPALRPHTPPPLSRCIVLRELLTTRPVKRLNRIGFLGALDRIRSRNWFSRYQHSVGVARLALLYADIQGLTQHDTNLVATAGLLHDIGHGPLSHSLEPVFKEYFDISHHDAGRNIIRGLSPLGQDIPKVLARYDLDVEEVLSMIEGHHSSPHTFLFSSPINLDTIEGMTRCHMFFSRKQEAPVSASGIVKKIASSEMPPMAFLDEFWKLKQHVYSALIHNLRNFFYDALAQASMVEDIGEFSREDFYKDDERLRRDKKSLFKYLDMNRTDPTQLSRELSMFVLSHRATVQTRTFSINHSIIVHHMGDLHGRYIQNKTTGKVSISDLLKRRS